MIVWVNTWAMHRDTSLWGEDALEFVPERSVHPRAGRSRRWLSRASSLPPSMAFMPFGAGRRTCPGQRLALVQMKCALATLLKTYSIEPSADTPHPPDVGGPGSLEPKISHVFFVPRDP